MNFVFVFYRYAINSNLYYLDISLSRKLKMKDTLNSIQTSPLLMKQLTRHYTQFKMGLLNLIGNGLSPLQILDSQIFNNFQEIIYPQTILTQDQRKILTQFQTRNSLKKCTPLQTKQQNQFSLKSYLNKYEFETQNNSNIVVIQAQRKSHSLSKYDRIKYQNIKNQNDVEIKMNQLIQQNNVQFVIFSNLNKKYQQLLQKERSKLMSLFNKKNICIGVCKDCLKIKEIEKISPKTKENFKSEIIQTQQQTVSEEQNEQDPQQTFIQNIKQLQELLKTININLIGKKQSFGQKYRRIILDQIQKIQFSSKQSKSSFLTNGDKSKQINTKFQIFYKNKNCDSFSQTENLDHASNESKTIGERQLTLLIKQKQLNRKIQDWKQQIQNIKKAYHDKQIQLKKKQKELQIYLNGKMVQLDIKSQQIIQLNGNKCRMNSITDLKNRLQLDSYRRNALINIERDQIELLIQKQNISCQQNVPTKISLISQIQKKTNKQSKISFQIRNSDK